MKPLTVIIPSRTASNLVRCVEAVRQHEPEARIIVVDDGITWTPENCGDSSGWGDICIIPGIKPFIFARAINQGIRFAGDVDIVAINDDALLETPHGFSIMQMAANCMPEVGIIGAVTDLTGQPLQRRQRNLAAEDQARHDPREGMREVEHLAFVCVLIPARTRNLLWKKAADAATRLPIGPSEVDLMKCLRSPFSAGFLDERYVNYGSDDLDYCMQVRAAGLKVMVHDACYVNHGSLHSSYRGAPTAAGDIWHNHRILREKWGMSPNPQDPQYNRLMAEWKERHS